MEMQRCPHGLHSVVRIVFCLAVSLYFLRSRQRIFFGNLTCRELLDANCNYLQRTQGLPGFYV